MRQYFLNKKNFCSIPTTVPFLKKIYVIFFLFFYIQIYIFIYSASSVMSSWIKIKLPCKTQCLSVTAYYIFRAGCTLIRQLQNRMKLLFSRFTLFQTVLFPPLSFSHHVTRKLLCCYILLLPGLLFVVVVNIFFSLLLSPVRPLYNFTWNMPRLTFIPSMVLG